MSLSCLFVVCVLFVVFKKMEQVGSKGPVTPLSLVLQHFKDFQGKTTQLGDKVYPEELSKTGILSLSSGSIPPSVSAPTWVWPA